MSARPSQTSQEYLIMPTTWQNKCQFNHHGARNNKQKNTWIHSDTQITTNWLSICTDTSASYCKHVDLKHLVAAMPRRTLEHQPALPSTRLVLKLLRIFGRDVCHAYDVLHALLKCFFRWVTLPCSNKVFVALSVWISLVTPHRFLPLACSILFVIVVVSPFFICFS